MRVPVHRDAAIGDHVGVDYNLTALGSREFEHLIQALCVEVLGPGVSAFGDGADGGREAAFRGPVEWGTADGGERWDGYTIVQAKFRGRPREPADNLEWLLRQIDQEVLRWTDTRYARARTAERPANLLLVTNVVLSATQGGGHDTATRALGSRAAKKGLVLKSSRIWHYDQLCTLLDTQPRVRTTYGGFVTVGDVLGNLSAALQRDGADKLGQALLAHATKELIARQWVRLGQAGDLEDNKLALGRVVIDVPAAVNGPIDAEDKGDRNSSVAAAAFLFGRGERVLDHGLHPDQPPHVLLVGSAGQGKSTLAQLVCQAYRVALLRDAGAVGAEAERLLAELQTDLDQIDLPLPKHRRWPFVVDLSDYGDRLLGGEDVPLLRYIADRISSRSPVPVTPAQLMTWLKSWPWLLVLDGLDEVAAPSVREHITRNVSDFLVDAAANGPTCSSSSRRARRATPASLAPRTTSGWTCSRCRLTRPSSAPSASDNSDWGTTTSFGRGSCNASSTRPGSATPAGC